MELTLENLVNEIVKQEYIYHDYMLESENISGRESDNYKLWRSKWLVLRNLAKKFNFVDKLER